MGSSTCQDVVMLQVLHIIFKLVVLLNDEKLECILRGKLKLKYRKLQSNFMDCILDKRKQVYI